MGNPARTDELAELPLSTPQTDDGPALDERQVLDTLEGSDSTPSIDAPKGIAIAMGLGAVIWLVLFAAYALIT